MAFRSGWLASLWSHHDLGFPCLCSVWRVCSISHWLLRTMGACSGQSRPHVALCGGIILPHYVSDFYITKFRSLFPCGGLVAKLSDSFVTSWTVVHKAPLSTGFPRQEYWSGLPFPSPGDIPDPGIEPQVSCISWQSLHRLNHQGSLSLSLLYFKFQKYFPDF